MRAIIVPSAPFKNYEEIESIAVKARGEVKRIQIDVCDGKYVPSISWPFTEYTKSDFENLGKKDDFDVFLPMWENLNYSVDLMVYNPEKYIETFVAYGVDEIIVHYRSIENDLDAFATIIEMSKKYDLKLYVAVDVQADLKKVITLANSSIESLTGFQVMGIKKIGYQGQEFSNESLDIVRTLKEQFPNKTMLFDGAINEDTVVDIKDAGVDVFCVGSYLTKAANFEENLQILKNLLR